MAKARRVELEVPGVGAVAAWLATPGAAPRAALVVVPEIFGANAHIRAVAEDYAAEGFLALAPAMFDPVEPDVELGYDREGFERGRALVAELGTDRAVAIIAAAAEHLAGRDGLAVGAVGFCWGGTIAFLANTRLGLPAVSYYGARTMPYLDEPLRAPMLFHFGEHDASIPATDVAAHGERQPTAAVHVYPAGHAFNRDVDPNAYEPASARLARQRTLAFFVDALIDDAGATTAATP